MDFRRILMDFTGILVDFTRIFMDFTWILVDSGNCESGNCESGNCEYFLVACISLKQGVSSNAAPGKAY